MILSVVLLVSIYSLPSKAAVYSYVDSRGIIHLTDRPTDPRYRMLYSSKKSERLERVRRAKQKNVKVPFNEVILAASRRHGVQSALIKAVIKAESGFNPLAVSRKGAVGLMQLMPATAKKYGVKNRLDPASNINGGVRFLRELLIMFKYDLRLSLAAYNAGHNAVKRYGYVIPPYPETRKYVTKVLKFYRKYQKSM
ncbi:MAG: lytic transglycosylase domain-containing protein [Magnetococcales bacterium]|nr:lytic transglycosylase domain-containing protein [Magnetococcales bacterium]